MPRPRRVRRRRRSHATGIADGRSLPRPGIADEHRRPDGARDPNAAGDPYRSRGRSRHAIARRRRPEPPTAHRPPADDDFKPANDVEETCSAAAAEGSTDSFLSTLLLATVLRAGRRPRRGRAARRASRASRGRTEEIDGEPYLVVFTSRDRLRRPPRPSRLGRSAVKFLAADPQTGPTRPGRSRSTRAPRSAPSCPAPQIIALASWAAEVGPRRRPGGAERRPRRAGAAQPPASDAAPARHA